MTDFTDSAQSKQIDQQEHNHDAGAKRVVMRYQDPNTAVIPPPVTSSASTLTLLGAG